MVDKTGLIWWNQNSVWYLLGKNQFFLRLVLLCGVGVEGGSSFGLSAHAGTAELLWKCPSLCVHGGVDGIWKFSYWMEFTRVSLFLQRAHIHPPRGQFMSQNSVPLCHSDTQGHLVQPPAAAPKGGSSSRNPRET